MIARDTIGAHHMLLTPGTRLGPYTIEALIGSGGMGEVYKAHDGRLNRTVAIKRVIAGDVSRFQSEARAIAAINHANTCQLRKSSLTPSQLLVHPPNRGTAAGYDCFERSRRHPAILGPQFAGPEHEAGERLAPLGFGSNP